MKILQERDVAAVSAKLSELERPVKLINFTQEFECQYCRETRWMLEDVTSLSGKLSLEVYNFQRDKEKVAEYRIDKIPATVVEGEKDYGIRFYGVPTGYEFATLLEDILAVSKRSSGLPQHVIERLRTVNQTLHIQVFVTPTCPMCPVAVKMAHQFAMENDLITADVVEAPEFPQLVQNHGVHGVPRTIVNDTVSIEGAWPVDFYLEKVLEAVRQKIS
ncbi:MAG TPA: thioredoxin family protein [Candidatus Binatia bacterium]|jgi:glutaredoxin-like protein